MKLLKNPRLWDTLIALVWTISSVTLWFFMMDDLAAEKPQVTIAFDITVLVIHITFARYFWRKTVSGRATK